MTTILANRRAQYGKLIWARVQIYFGIIQSTVYLPFILYIQLFKENATFKLHFVLIVLPCKKHNCYIYATLKRTLSNKNTHTQLINIPNNKNFKTKQTNYDPQLQTSCVQAPTNACCILSYCVTFMYMSATDILLKMVFIPWGEESGL